MLVESFIAASSAPPKAASVQSSLSKDAGIFQHTFQPQPALRSTFKKSAVQPSCVAISQSHVFAAQSEKAVVHIYSREKGNQEATIPFPERIHSIVLAADETVAVLGTVSGALTIWETGTGRSLSTQASHLQAVNVLAVDPADNYIISGSGDATVLVWSLVDLLTFSNPGVEGTKHLREARHALTGHDGPITALACGHSRATTNIAITTSTDKTAIVWDYISGTRLRTILLASSPLCLTIDPADRAAYAGYEDGSVQRINFFSLDSVDKGIITNGIRDPSKTQTPLQLTPSSHWPYPASTDASEDVPQLKTKPSKPQKLQEKVTHPNATLAMTLSYTGTSLLSSHANGSIHEWDVSTGRLASTLATYTGAPITNIEMLPPTGFSNTPAPRLQQKSIVKPRAYETFASPGLDKPNAAYTLLASFPKPFGQPLHHQRLRKSAHSLRLDRRDHGHTASRIEIDLFGPGVSRETLEEGAREISLHLSAKTKGSKAVNTRKGPYPSATATDTDDHDKYDADFLPLPPEDPELTALRTENARLSSLDARRDALQQKLVAGLTEVGSANAVLKRQLADERALRDQEDSRKEEDARIRAKWKQRHAKKAASTTQVYSQGNRQRRRESQQRRSGRDVDAVDRIWAAMDGPIPANSAEKGEDEDDDMYDPESENVEVGADEEGEEDQVSGEVEMSEADGNEEAMNRDPVGESGID